MLKRAEVQELLEIGDALGRTLAKTAAITIDKDDLISAARRRGAELDVGRRTRRGATAGAAAGGVSGVTVGGALGGAIGKRFKAPGVGKAIGTAIGGGGGVAAGHRTGKDIASRRAASDYILDKMRLHNARGTGA